MFLCAYDAGDVNTILRLIQNWHQDYFQRNIDRETMSFALHSGAKGMCRRSLPWFQNQSYPYVGKSTRRLGFAYCIKCRVLAYLYLFCSYTERKIVSTVRLCSILSLIFWCLTVLGLQSSWLFVASDRPCIPSDLLSSRRQRYLTRYLHTTIALLPDPRSSYG